MRERLQHSIAAVLCLGLIAAFVAAGRASSFDPTAACISHSRELVATVQQYVEDYDERLPAMATSAQFKAALLPYSQSPAIFVCPATATAYVPNPAISGHQITQLNTDTTVAFEDAVAHNGAKTVTYLDGTVTRNGIAQGDPTSLCMQYAHELVVATLQYAQDHDERLPPTDTQADFRAALTPYVTSSRVFTCPVTGDAYVPNPALSGAPLASITQPYSQVVVVEDAVPHRDGFSTIGYLDGHVVHGNNMIPMPSTSQGERSLMLSVLQYAQDNGVLPPTSSYASFETALRPYVSDPSLFYDPSTGLPFALNPSVGGMSLSSIANPAQTVFLQAPRLDSDGVLYIAYVDGHVAPEAYHIVRTMTISANNDTRLVWFWASDPSNAHDYGGESLWDINSNGKIVSQVAVGIGISTVSESVQPGGTVRLLSDDPQVSAPIPGAAGLTTVPDGGPASTTTFGPFDGWAPIAVGVGPNDRPVALWDYYNGTAAIWQMSSAGAYVSSFELAPPSIGSAADLAVGSDNDIRLLWANGNGTASVETFDPTGVFLGLYSLGPVSGDSPVSITVDANRNVRLLWAGADGSAQVWSINSSHSVYSRISFPAQAGWRAAKVGVGGDGNSRILWKNVDDTARVDTVQPSGALVSSRTYAPIP